MTPPRAATRTGRSPPPLRVAAGRPAELEPNGSIPEAQARDAQVSRIAHLPLPCALLHVGLELHAESDLSRVRQSAGRSSLSVSASIVSAVTHLTPRVRACLIPRISPLRSSASR